MARVSIAGLQLLVKRVLVALFATSVLLALLLSLLWRDRVPLSDIALPPAPVAAGDVSAVTLTWFGVATLLIDDGDTQLLVDAFISRPSLMDVLMRRPVTNDAATINFVLNEYRMRRLAAIMPVHSHFDHAMDVGAVANRSSASVLGSETTAHIARGAGVPEDQIVVVEPGQDYTFGEFTVRFLTSVHAPIGWGGSVPLKGTLDAPLELPAPVTAFPDGGSYSIVISHPQGSMLVQGSAGMREAALDDVQVDTVILGVGLLEGLGRKYVEEYWQKTVTSTGARVIVPVHFDDYTKPFGKIELAPKILDNFGKTVRLLEGARKTWDSDSRLFLPEFGVPFLAYPADDPEV